MSERLSHMFRLALRSDLPPALLCGAGVSVAPPACLPTVVSLFRQYHDRLNATLLHTRERLSVVPPLETWVAGIRFEEALSVFQSLLNYSTQPIEPLDHAREPNENHYILATLANAGCPILTTNFDILIEIAILESASNFGTTPTMAHRNCISHVYCASGL